jgi:hypothetical protein
MYNGMFSDTNCGKHALMGFFQRLPIFVCRRIIHQDMMVWKLLKQKSLSCFARYSGLNKLLGLQSPVEL